MKRRLNGEGTVYPESDPNRKTTHRAQMEVRLPDGTVHRVVARGYSETDALKKARAKAQRAQEVMPEADRLTLRDYLHKWLAYKHGQVRASTMYTYMNDVDNIKRHLGHAKLGRLRPYDVQTMLDRLRHEAGNHKGGHGKVDKARRTLKQALRQAVRWELIPKSPVEQLQPVRAQPVERSAWGPEEISKFLQAVKESQRPQTYYPLFVAALFTGMRGGELFALRWRDVADDHITVRRSWSPHAEGEEEQPKTKAGVRTIPISPFVREALGARGEPDELVFKGQHGTRIRREKARRSLRHFAKKAGVPPIKLHDLRRTYATTLARLGHHPSVIQALLGHATPHLAMTVYTDVLEEQRQAARLEPEAVMNGASFGADANATTPSRGHYEDDTISGAQAVQDEENAATDANS